MELKVQMKYKKFEEFDDVCKITADKLVENKIIAWFQGKSEFGPRALGNRSIFANPTFDNKDYLNKEVKGREYWRPFAPIILESELKNWFDLPRTNSHYMLFNARVLNDKLGKKASIEQENVIIVRTTPFKGTAEIQLNFKLNTFTL